MTNQQMLATRTAGMIVAVFIGGGGPVEAEISLGLRAAMTVIAKCYFPIR